ncbi:hypothetical protein [Bacillus velezensis]|uniref:hypothetical protein n=1 Tax=Bacillus velezensis TaxID=492670 RepID=UPI001643A926|nr:hypothetical protein [Bacillus velezensis]
MFFGLIGRGGCGEEEGDGEKEGEEGGVEGEGELRGMEGWLFEGNFTDKDQWNEWVMVEGKEGFDGEVVEKRVEALIEEDDGVGMV